MFHIANKRKLYQITILFKLHQTQSQCCQKPTRIATRTLWTLVLFPWSTQTGKNLRTKVKKKPFKLYCYSNIDHLVESWYTWILKILQSCLKKKTNHKRSQPPYITPSTSNLIKKRLNTLKKRKKKQPTKDNKAREYGETCKKNLVDEYQTNFEAVTFEG